MDARQITAALPPDAESDPDYIFLGRETSRVEKVEFHLDAFYNARSKTPCRIYFWADGEVVDCMNPPEDCILPS